jgi:hypothetical protein
MTRPIVSNRFRPGLAGVVGVVAQNGLFVLDVAGISFDEALTRARRAATRAYKHAYFDPVQLDELIARVAARRGPDFDVRCFFNDRRGGRRRGGTGPAPTPEQIREALPRTTFSWLGRQDRPFESLFIHVDDMPDTIQLAIFIDTHLLSPADAQACLHAMEGVAVEAAANPGTPTRVARVPVHA